MAHTGVGNAPMLFDIHDGAALVSDDEGLVMPSAEEACAAAVNVLPLVASDLSITSNN